MQKYFIEENFVIGIKLSTNMLFLKALLLLFIFGVHFQGGRFFNKVLWKLLVSALNLYTRSRWLG